MKGKTSTTGLVLAGGAGRRVQGRDKGLIFWQGKPLIEHVADRLTAQVDYMLLSCNRNKEKYSHYADSLISDGRHGFQGPLAGIESAIEWLESEYLIVVACDTPRLPRDLVQRLLQPLLSTDTETPRISYANDGRRDQYLFTAIHCSALDSLPGYLASGQRSVRHWIQLHPSVAVDFSDRPDAFDNFNDMDSIQR